MSGDREHAASQIVDHCRYQPATYGAHSAQRRVPGFESEQHREVQGHGFQLAANPPGALKNQLSELSGLGAASTSYEKRHSEFVFELADHF